MRARELKAARAWLELSQGQLADALDVHRITSVWETGAKLIPRTVALAVECLERRAGGPARRPSPGRNPVALARRRGPEGVAALGAIVCLAARAWQITSGGRRLPAGDRRRSVLMGFCLRSVQLVGRRAPTPAENAKSEETTAE